MNNAFDASTVENKNSQELNQDFGLTIIENRVEKPKALLIFAHGAGADMNHEFMAEMTQLFNDAQMSVVRFNFPYMNKRIETGKRYPPDRMPKLMICYQQVLAECIARYNVEDGKDTPIFIGGKSMGSRVAATLGGMDEFTTLIQGIFCLGYPFHPSKKPEKLRLEPLQETKVPLLIVQGERDTLGNQEEVNAYELSNKCQCYFLKDGDHSLKPRVKSGYTYEQHKNAAVHLILTFVCKVRLLNGK